MSFAALQSRVNAGVLAKLSDDATVNGVAVVGKFTAPSAMAFGGMVEGGKPTLECMEVDVPAVKRGDPVTHAGIEYLVSGAPEPDGMGMVALRLEINQ